MWDSSAAARRTAMASINSETDISTRESGKKEI
jgi:hypothetical protein